MTPTENQSSRQHKRGIHSGRLRRPSTCQLSIAASLLARYGYKDQADAHNNGMCARLYALGRRTAAL
ncbi:hypothetical protein OG413_44890 [Streptomyces sp. NBC_01433]|uniref:hypothetical protein n=1 Tax=unclassified Streptomyces TaxID=2593676 RepID=UPI00224D4EDA|nr:hypothetical protein [Streptomyces sp. NBC_01433]MCX4682323.1 hypothetical protein [Streptomyces sp. NBC_01433]